MKDQRSNKTKQEDAILRLIIKEVVKDKYEKKKDKL